MVGTDTFDYAIEEDKQISDLAFELLGINYFELKKLNVYCRAGQKFDDLFIDEVIEAYKQLTFDDYQEFVIKEMNGLMWCAINSLFEEIYDLVKQVEDSGVEDMLDGFADDFDPYIEGTNSGFNNCFDELDLKQTKEEIVRQAIELMKIEKERLEGGIPPYV